MMEERKNKVKNRTPFKEYITNRNENGDVSSYLKQNYIPESVPYDLRNFEEFFKNRKAILKGKLIEILKN